MSPISDDHRVFELIDTNNIEELKQLLKNGLDPNSISMAGISVLEYSFFKNMKEVVELLMSYNAKLNLIADVDGWTPIHYIAAIAGIDYYNIAENLFKLENCSEIINLKTNDGSTALDLAIDMHDWQTVKLLVDNGAKFDC